MSSEINARFRYYIRLSGSGDPIPGSVVRRYHKPKGKYWLDITDCTNPCCSAPSYVIFTNNHATQTITGISDNLGNTETITIAQNGFYVLPIDPTTTSIKVTIGHSGTIATINSSTVQGGGVIAAHCLDHTSAVGDTYTFTITPSAGSQYLITLTSGTTSC